MPMPNKLPFNNQQLKSQAEEECSVSVGGDKDSGFVEERRVSLADIS